MVQVAKVDSHRRVKCPRKTGKTRTKNKSCSYYKPVDGADERVYQQFFCNTPAISKKTVTYAINHVNDLGHLVQQISKLDDHQ